jgi:hypothetical protein
MIDHKIWDALLPAFADLYESGNKHYMNEPVPENAEEFEPLRETLAELVAEGTLRRFALGTYQLTSLGYLRYKARLSALRTLPAER